MIVVLGVLAAIVIFSLTGISGKGSIAACDADGATLANAIAIYHQQNGANPVDDAALIGNGVQSMPNNLPHYAFGIVTGVLYIEIPGTSAWQITPVSTGTGVMAYTTSASCSAVT